MLGMNPELLAELRTLRERAYGPDSDIHDDPDALRRLESLEARASGATTAGALEAAPAEAAPAAEADEGAAPPPATTSADDLPGGVGADAASVTPRRSARWMPWAWLISIVAVAALAVAWTYGAMVVALKPIDVGPSAAEPVAILQLHPGLVAPAFFGDETVEVSGSKDFYGVTAFRADEWFGAPPDSSCFFVVHTKDLAPDVETMSGTAYSACSVGGFPATAEIGLTQEWPEELRERFPDSDALQFVLDGDRVAIIADEAEAC